MGEIRFGHREGPGKGKEYPVAASQTFYRRGGHFVYLDSAGAVTVARCNAATTIMGWAEIPKENTDTAMTYWTSSSTAKNDKVFVIRPTTGDIFEIPSVDTTLTATQIGKGAALVLRSSVQKADIGNTASVEMLTVVGIDNDNDTVLVTVKAKYLQNV